MPRLPHSHAVSRAPWSSGRVSSTHTCTARAPLVGGPHHAQRGAPAHAGQRAGVAVRQHAAPSAEQRRAVAPRWRGSAPRRRPAMATASATGSAAARARCAPHARFTAVGRVRDQICAAAAASGLAPDAGEGHAHGPGRSEGGRAPHGQVAMSSHSSSTVVASTITSSPGSRR